MIPASGSVRRVALCIQYDGTNYCGWQRQRNARAKPSVQGVLEAALRSLDPSIGSCVAAGRTDAGVHAAGQVVHFDTAGPVPDQRWARALNGRLPPSIRVNATQGVPQGWHACFSAVSRRYRYTVYNGRAPNLFLSAWSWHRYQVWIDDCVMATALNGLLGEHDFRAFQRSGSRRAHARTTIQEVDLQRHGDLLTVEIQASGFLYGMVRLLMAQLVSVGEGRLSPEAFDRRWREGIATRFAKLLLPGSLPAARRLSQPSVQRTSVLRWSTPVSAGGERPSAPCNPENHPQRFQRAAAAVPSRVMKRMTRSLLTIPDPLSPAH